MIAPTMTEVLHKIRPEWGEKVRNKVQQKLHKVDVTDVDKLCFAVMDKSLNSKLAVAGEKRLCSTTLMKLRVELGKRHRELTSQDDNTPAAEIGKPKQCFCMHCLQQAGNPALGVRSCLHPYGSHGIVQGAAKAPLDFGLSNAHGARPFGARLGEATASKNLLKPGSKGLSEKAYEVVDLQFPMAAGAVKPDNFWPRMEARLLQKSSSEPSFPSMSPGMEVSLSGQRGPSGISGMKRRRSQVLDMVPERGGMRRDDDALDGLLREAGEMISRAKTGKMQTTPVPEPLGLAPQKSQESIPCGPAFAALEAKVLKDIPRDLQSKALQEPVLRSSQGLQRKSPDEGRSMQRGPGSSELDFDDLCVFKSRLAAETAFESDRTEVSSAATLMAPSSSGGRRQQPILNNGQKWEPSWKRGKRHQIMKFYGEDSELRRRELFAQAL